MDSRGSKEDGELMDQLSSLVDWWRRNAAERVIGYNELIPYYHVVELFTGIIFLFFPE